MSQFLTELAAYVKRNPDPNLHVVTAESLADEDGHQLPQAEPTMAKAELVRPDEGVGGKPVGDPTHGRFAYFMDGIERTRVMLYYSGVPVVYGYVAAAIRRRGTDRLMCTHEHTCDEALYVPYKLVSSGFVGQVRIRTVDTLPGEESVQEHPLVLREAARKAISKARGRLEQQLTRKWLAELGEDDRWLVVDGSLGGTLGGDYQDYTKPNILGIIKSHQTQYFGFEDQRKILQLGVGKRSGIFKPLGRHHKAPVYSWYLRLRPSVGQDVYFGLVRVEAAADDRTLEMADEISRWLLAERTPLSLPDSRWDKMIYPIRDCEQYLRAVAPTKLALEASLIGAGAT